MLGILISTVGGDPSTGVLGYTFGVQEFASGFASTPALIGLFVLSEVFTQMERIATAKSQSVASPGAGGLGPT